MSGAAATRDPSITQPKERAADWQVTAYRYGLLCPLDWGDDCDDELRKQTALWNKLVEIDRANRDEVRAVALSDAASQAGEAAVAAALKRVDELVTRIKARNKAARSKVAWHDLTAELDVARRQVAAAALRAKAARRASYAANREALRELEDKRVRAVVEARQQSGLWWGNYNAVIDSYETGRRSARKRNGELHFRRHDGSGRLTNQIQGGMTPDELFWGTRAQICIGPRPEGLTDRNGRMAKKGRRILSLTATVYTRGRELRRTVTWPIILHRPLPTDCRIQSAVVVRESRGGHWVWSVSFTIRVPKPPMRVTGGRAAINLGWRSTTSGLRVATVVREGAEEAEHVYLPQRLIDGVARSDSYRSQTDHQVISMSHWLRNLSMDCAPEPLRNMCAELREKSRLSPRHFVSLLRVWSQECPSWQPNEYCKLKLFVHDNRKSWSTDSNRRAWVRDARKAHYEAETLRLLGDISEVVINMHDMSATARREGSDLHPRARRNRVAAAPHLVRTTITNLARRTGIRITEIGVSNDRCHFCSAELRGMAAEVQWWKCNQCGTSFDQDENFCRRMLCDCSDGVEARSIARNRREEEMSKSYGRVNRRHVWKAGSLSVE